MDVDENVEAPVRKNAHERFRDPEQAAHQLLHAAVVNDGKGVKIERPDGSLETYVVKRIQWGDKASE